MMQKIQNTQRETDEIMIILERNPEGLSRGKISENITFSIHPKTLQRRLASLVGAERILKKGNKKSSQILPCKNVLKV